MDSGENDLLVPMVDRATHHAIFFSSTALFSIVVWLVIKLFITKDLESAATLDPIFILVVVLCFINTICIAIKGSSVVAYIFAALGVFAVGTFCISVIY